MTVDQKENIFRILCEIYAKQEGLTVEIIEKEKPPQCCSTETARA